MKSPFCSSFFVRLLLRFMFASGKKCGSGVLPVPSVRFSSLYWRLARERLQITCVRIPSGTKFLLLFPEVFSTINWSWTHVWISHRSGWRGLLTPIQNTLRDQDSGGTGFWCTPQLLSWQDWAHITLSTSSRNFLKATSQDADIMITRVSELLARVNFGIDC